MLIYKLKTPISRTLNHIMHVGDYTLFLLLKTFSQKLDNKNEAHKTNKNQLIKASRTNIHVVRVYRQNIIDD